MSNIFVTGGVGFIGVNLIKRLVKEGHNVVSVDNYSTGFKHNEIEGCKYYDFNVVKSSDYSNLMEKPDVIFHLGALARIQPSIKNPKSTIENNFNSTLNILEWARKTNTEVIYAGSSSFHHGLYGSPYAWSKYGGEELCKLYSEVYGINTSICRFYNVYGDHMIYEGDYATVIAIFEKQFEEGKPLTITGDGEQRRDFTHVDDIVDDLIKCIGKNHKAEIFELGRGENFSINEIAEMFNTDTTYIDARPGEYPTTLCDYSKAQKDLNWKPTKNLKDYIEGVVGD